jgi:hypothetical protein
MPQMIGISEGPPVAPFQIAIFNPSDSETYYCYARNPVADPAVSGGKTTAPPAITTISNAAEGVITFLADHQFHQYARPRVTISGLTGAWAGVNGSRVLSWVSATEMAIVGVNTTALGAVAGTPVAATKCPRLSDPVWAIKKEVRDATGRSVFLGWAEGSSAQVNRASSRADYAYF